MKRVFFWCLWLSVNMLLISSCAVPYTLVASGRHVATAENFAVDLPEGWRQHNASVDPLLGPTLEKRHKLGWDVIRISRDGLLLQQIAIGRIPVSNELANTKKKLAQEMIALEAAEVIVDEMRSNSNLTNQDILENAPATLGGHPGFKLHYAYRTEERLKMEGLFYGALVEQWLYYIFYEAPAQHYFSKDLELFERTRTSFTITKGPSGK